MLTVDTSPLWFLDPTDSWHPYFPYNADIRYTSAADPPQLFSGQKAPDGGVWVSLPYVIEDELTRAPLPSDVSVTVKARSVEADAVARISLDCKTMVGKMTAHCWHELAALPVGRCAAAWPVAVDGDKTLVRIARAPGAGPDCDLVIGVVPARESGSVHAIVLKLLEQSP